MIILQILSTHHLLVNLQRNPRSHKLSKSHFTAFWFFPIHCFTVCKKKRISFQNKKRREDKNITITHGLMTMNVFHNLFNPSNRKFERCYVVFETTKYFSYGTNSKLLFLYKSPTSQVWWVTSIKAWSAMSYGCLHLVLNPIRKSNQKNDRWYYKCRKMRLPVLLIYKMTDYWQPTVHLLVIRATHICTSIFVQIY